jgi:hypothetical protein
MTLAGTVCQQLEKEMRYSQPMRDFLTHLPIPVLGGSSAAFLESCATPNQDTALPDIDPYFSAIAGTLLFFFFDSGILIGESKPCFVP